RSSSASTSAASCLRASTMAPLGCFKSLAARCTIGARPDTLVLDLRLPKLGFAVCLQSCAAFIGFDRLLEPAHPALRTLDYLLDLFESLLKAHHTNIVGNAVGVGHQALSMYPALASHQRPHVSCGAAAQCRQVVAALQRGNKPTAARMIGNRQKL